jgi:hypothetical protein
MATPGTPRVSNTRCKSCGYEWQDEFDTQVDFMPAGGTVNGEYVCEACALPLLRYLALQEFFELLGEGDSQFLN